MPLFLVPAVLVPSVLVPLPDAVATAKSSCNRGGGHGYPNNEANSGPQLDSGPHHDGNENPGLVARANSIKRRGTDATIGEETQLLGHTSIHPPADNTRYGDKAELQDTH